MATVTPTDRPKSVRNHCVIEAFGDVFVLSHCLLDFSVGVGAFFIGLSQISSFFSLKGGIEMGLVKKRSGLCNYIWRLQLL